MESFDKLNNRIIKQLKPTKSERATLDKTIDKMMVKVNQAIESLNLSYTLEPILVGSVAKDTYLKDPDIDIFIMFPVSVPVDELRKLGLKLGHLVLPAGEERYAEHPYIFGKFDGFDTDIVPCFKLATIEDRMTAVDRTPFHTKFIIEHLKPGQIDEVRLFKQFIKGIGAYGAEIEVLGFSGYLCELLILRYGTFLNLLKGVGQWPNELVLRLGSDKHKKGQGEKEFFPKSQLTKTLAIKFKDEPLVFIDPVDKARNVASAVSRENLSMFRKAAEMYLENPRLEFFFPNTIKPLNQSQLKKQLKSYPNTILGLAFTTPEVVPDILHGQLRKSVRVVQRFLDSEGFGVVHAKYFCDDQTILLFELEIGKLGEVENHIGPPGGHKNVKDFLAKWRSNKSAISKPYLKDQRWYVDIKREFTTPVKLLEANILKLSLGKYVLKAVQAGAQINQDLDLVKKGMEEQLTLFLTRKYPWEY